MADKTPALRVSQLDAQELDQEVLNLTKHHLSNLFKYFQTGFLGRYDPEVTAAIKLILWKFTLQRQDQTVGQQLLGTKYAVTRGQQAGQWLSSRHKAQLAFLYVACPWLSERLTSVLAVLGLEPLRSQAERCLRWINTAVKVATLVNFVVFLRQGVHVSVPERLVGVRAQFPARQALRQISFDFMTREILWHGFSEFLVFLLPLISIQRVKNTILRWVAHHPLNAEGYSASQRSKSDLMECMVCRDWPVHPHHIGCRHVFCHYCIASNVKADPGYRCPVCGKGDVTGHGVVSPQPVLLTIGPDH